MVWQSRWLCSARNAKRPDLAGWYTGENSGGVPPRPLFVELAAGGFTRARGPCAERVPSSAYVLLVHTPHGRRQLAPPGARVLGRLVTCTPFSQAQAMVLGSFLRVPLTCLCGALCKFVRLAYGGGARGWLRCVPLLFF